MRLKETIKERERMGCGGGLLLTQFVAVHLSSTRINRVHLQLYFHAVLCEMFSFRKHNNEMIMIDK